jgi:hypothetical protein
MPRHSTARRFEAATGGRIKWHQFFEIEQGGNPMENPTDGCTDASSDNAAFTRPARSTIQEESHTREDAHVGNPAIAG